MNIRLFLLLPVVLFSLTQCSTTKNGFQNKTPFTIIESFYQDWGGGQEGVSGTIIQLIVKDLKSNVQPSAIYFNNKVAKIDLKNSDKGILWVANFSNSKKYPIKKDLNMYDNSKKEYGNTLPAVIAAKKFNLQENEAVIAYQYKGSLKYFKLEELLKKETIFFPSAQPKR